MRTLVLRLTAVFTTVAAITIFCWRLVPVNATTAGFAYLIAILVIAASWSFLEALIASLVSVLCFNFFFFEPRGTFNIAEPENWVALFAFLATSLVASQLSARARQRTQEALDRQREMDKLYALSRAILLIDLHASPGQQIAKQIQNIFGFRGVGLYDHKGDEIHFAGSPSLAEFEDQLRGAAFAGTQRSVSEGDTVFTPIRLAGESVGGLAIQGESISQSALQALANLVAIALEKVRGQEIANRAEAARQSEELKSTLLDSLAHEFKTPLTSIKAASTALLSSVIRRSDEQRELVAIVDEEADRLTRLVTEATDMARIEAGELRLNTGLHSVAELIDLALQKMRPMTEGRNVVIRIADALPPIHVDPQRFELALRQIIDNAVKYSPPASAVVVNAAHAPRGVVISVTDQGPGIPEHERSRVFEKFYRSPYTHRHVLGTGMGLAIAREIVSAHGGEIGFENLPEGGTRFWIAVPSVVEEEIA